MGLYVLVAQPQNAEIRLSGCMNLSVGNPCVQMSDGILYVRGFIKCCKTNPEDNGAEKEHSPPRLFWGGGEINRALGPRVKMLWLWEGTGERRERGGQKGKKEH